MPDDEKHYYRNWALGIAAVVIGSLILFILTSPGGPLYEFISHQKTPHIKIALVNTPEYVTNSTGAGQIFSTEITVHNDGDAIASNCRAKWYSGQDPTVYSHSKYFAVKTDEDTTVNIVTPTFYDFKTYDTSICIECDNNIKSDCVQRSIFVGARKFFK